MVIPVKRLLNAWRGILLFSLLVIAFSLGMARSMVLVPPVGVGLDFDPAPDSRGEFRRPHWKVPERDRLLCYRGKTGNLLSDPRMQVQGMPFTFYQFYTRHKPDKVAKWYRDRWNGRDLLVIARYRDGDPGGSVETLDWKNRRFLNVFFRRDDSQRRTEILATALDIDYDSKRDFKRRLDFKKSGLTSRGSTPGGGRWQKIIREERGGVGRVFRRTLCELAKGEWNVIQKEKDDSRASITAARASKKETRFMIFQKVEKAGSTLVHELLIRENDE
jgi:hypothetical protein